MRPAPSDEHEASPFESAKHSTASSAARSIGLADVVGVVERHPSKWFSGPLGWMLRNPRPLPRPIPCAGRLGLWELPRIPRSRDSS